MRKRLLTWITITCFFSSANAQEGKLPLEMENGHLFSQWIINDSIEARVFVESGFPKIVINEAFARRLGLELIPAPDSTRIRLWSSPSPYPVPYLIQDSLTVNGRKLAIDALVVDYSAIPSWDGRDMVFPIVDLGGKVELNIKEKYMKVLPHMVNVFPGHSSFDVTTDEWTRGIYLNTTLTCYDATGTNEELSGNFLFDLGAGNMFFINKNRSEGADFTRQADRMLLDPSTYPKNPRTELEIIKPEKILFCGFEIPGAAIPSMKIHSSRASDQYVGIAGNPFFRNFVVVFDFENNKFYLKPHSGIIKMPEN